MLFQANLSTEVLVDFSSFIASHINFSNIQLPNLLKNIVLVASVFKFMQHFYKKKEYKLYNKMFKLKRS